MKEMLLSREDINDVFSQLEMDSETSDAMIGDKYYNFWDFGKEPDESQAVSSISIDYAKINYNF